MHSSSLYPVLSIFAAFLPRTEACTYMCTVCTQHRITPSPHHRITPRPFITNCTGKCKLDARSTGTRNRPPAKSGGQPLRLHVRRVQCSRVMWGSASCPQANSTYPQPVATFVAINRFHRSSSRLPNRIPHYGLKVVQSWSLRHVLKASTVLPRTLPRNCTG